MWIILIPLAMVLLPPLLTGGISISLSPKGRFRIGLALALAGIAALLLPYLYGIAALQPVRPHPVAATGTTEISFRTWIGGWQRLRLVTSAPEGVELSCAMVGRPPAESGCLGETSIDWVLREGDTVIARGNPNGDWTPVDPALQADADRTGERGRQLRVEQGLPPEPVPPRPQRREIFLGNFPAAFSHRYTLQLTPYFDPRLDVRVSVASARQKDYAAWFVLGLLCGLVWLAAGAGIAIAGRRAGRRQ